MPGTFSLRTGFAVLLGLAAVWPLALIALHEASPAQAAGLAGQAAQVLRGVGWGAGGMAAAGMVLYPPFLPWLRVQYETLRRRMSVEQGPAVQARGRLAHFENPDDHLTVGRTALAMGQNAQALPHLVRAVELDPSHAGARYFLGRALLSIGQLEPAIEQLRTATAQDEDHAFGAAQLELAFALERAQQDEEALATFARHADRHGDNRRALLARARILRRLGRGDEAKTLLQEAAAPPRAGEPLSKQEQLARARAKVALWRGGAT